LGVSLRTDLSFIPLGLRDARRVGLTSLMRCLPTMSRIPALRSQGREFRPCSVGRSVQCLTLLARQALVAQDPTGREDNAAGSARIWERASYRLPRSALLHPHSGPAGASSVLSDRRWHYRPGQLRSI